MSDFKLNWKGDDIRKQVHRKAANALNETAADAVSVAQKEAPRDTGFMANTIEVVKEATETEQAVTWGNVTANYTLWQEIGSQGRPGRYFLRTGADEAYPGLKKRLERGL